MGSGYHSSITFGDLILTHSQEIEIRGYADSAFVIM
jgi:hypothetical protein